MASVSTSLISLSRDSLAANHPAGPVKAGRKEIRMAAMVDRLTIAICPAGLPARLEELCVAAAAQQCGDLFGLAVQGAGEVGDGVAYRFAE